MNIVQRRLEKLIRVTAKSSINKRKGRNCLRTSSRHGGIRLGNKVFLILLDGDKPRLDAFAKRVKIARSVIMRDAINFYLDIAEKEFAAEDHAPMDLCYPNQHTKKKVGTNANT